MPPKLRRNTAYGDFLHRYCVVRMKQISRFNRIPVIMGGRNLEELKARMDGFILRRTQADIGMQPPIDLDLYAQVHVLVPRTITSTDGSGATLSEARERAYSGAASISIEGSRYRSDIGDESVPK